MNIKPLHKVLCHKCNLAKSNRLDLKATRERLGEL